MFYDMFEYPKGYRILITLIVTLTLAIASDRSLAVGAQKRYLLLDSRIIENTQNAKLTLGTVRKDINNPLFKEDKPWEPRFDNPYCSVIFDEEDKIFKCWYSIFIKSGARGDFPGEGLASEKRAWVNWTEGKRDFGVCYATSRDGIHWEKPGLGLIEFDGSKKNNIVIEFNHGVTVIKDLRRSVIRPFIRRRNTARFGSLRTVFTGGRKLTLALWITATQTIVCGGIRTSASM